MVYYIISGIAFVILLLLVLGAIFFRDKIIFFLAAGIVGISLLSFYIFYYISSYNSSPQEVTMDRSFKKTKDGYYILDMHIVWNKKPEIFGLNGNDDLLILRYDPKEAEILSSNKTIKESEIGKTTVKLSKNFNYSQIEKNEKEVYFRLKDGADNDVSVTFKGLADKVPVKIFYLHDYSTPLEGTIYWEKDDELDLVSLAKGLFYYERSRYQDKLSFISSLSYF